MLNKALSSADYKNITVLSQIWENESSFSYSSKIRPYSGICFILSGSIKYRTASREYTANAGDIVILKKTARYKALFCQAPPTADILINFQSDGFGDAFFKSSSDEIIVLNNRVDLKRSFSDALSYYMMADRPCIVKSAFFKILDGICAPEEASTALSAVKTALEADTDFNLKEPELAKMCSVSVSTFQRMFKKNFGKSFTEYKNERRILKAKELLAEGLSMEEISEALGFCDSSYFSKCFKREAGISPKKYLKQHYTM